MDGKSSSKRALRKLMTRKKKIPSTMKNSGTKPIFV
jgi:hypothetical protein